MPLRRLPQPLPLTRLLEEAALPCRVEGRAERQVTGFCAPEEMEAGGLCFLREPTPEGLETLAAVGSVSVILPEAQGQTLPPDLTGVYAANPMRLFIACIEAGLPRRPTAGIQAGAFVHGGAALGEGVSVEAGAYIDEDVVIGPGCAIHAGVRLYPGVRLGARVVVQSNAVLGGEGLAFAEDDTGLVLFPHLGRVLIGDDVSIGHNSTVIRGILVDTVIGAGTKIGNQVNVGHNVRIGEHCFISAGAILCGSAVVEDGCRIAPGTIILNHVRVGARARVTAGAVVARDVAPDTKVAGYPARVVPRQ